ncbi:unnamed protein product [Linum trigynum]
MMMTPFHRSRVVGLQAVLLADTAASLLQISGHHHDQHHTNHVITKSLTALLPPSLPSSSSSSSSSPDDDGHLVLLLQSCHFCSTRLSPKKDVYMYKGDQGFCSRQCRDKQVKLDEINEAEESNLIFHLNNSYNSRRRRRRQLRAAPLLEICSSGSTACSHRRGENFSCSIPRRRPVSQYINRPLPLPPHQRLGYMNHRRQLAS